MGKKKDFISDVKQTRRLNGKTFIEQAAIDGTSFDLIAADVTDVTTKWHAFDDAMTAEQTLIEQLSVAVSQTKVADAAFEKEERKLAGKIKKSNGYTEGVGHRYDIIGEGEFIDIATSKPVLKLVQVPHGWEIEFNLHDFFSGVKIWRQRPGGVKTFLATDTRTPYVDNEAQVDGTKYSAFYLRGDDEVGKESDDANVKV